jgi:hypothetical protein
MLIGFDPHKQFRRYLHLPTSDFTWSSLVDPSGIVRFSSPFVLKEDVMRRLTERFIAGKVTYEVPLMASAAGYIGAHLYDPALALGPAYDKAMKDEIFGPLGMTESTFDMERAQHGNFASPHGDDIDQHPAVAGMDTNYSVVPFLPAGGLWSSAHDMTRYALVDLSRGKLPIGEQLVSEENLLVPHRPQISTTEDEAYGMGLGQISHQREAVGPGHRRGGPLESV